MNARPIIFAWVAISMNVFPLSAAEIDRAGQPSTCIDGAVAVGEVQDLIRKESQRQGADVKLALAVSGQESGFGQRVNSPAGARGVMQLMPETAARYGVADVCDAAQNIRGGVSFLKDLEDRFGGNIFLIVAAYNAGEDRVLRARGVPAIAETVNYVALVANAYYGFENVFRQDRRGAIRTATDAGVDLLTTGSLENQPASIHPEQSKPAERTWIGGSVLYVQ
ncbi:lytic transglycosylase domain-containing protein [Agrobacterium larrymoorei]|nr:lytic transglycosylase domain-containing protein [Agrobacterium larrymoorei]